MKFLNILIFFIGICNSIRLGRQLKKKKNEDDDPTKPFKEKNIYEWELQRDMDKKEITDILVSLNIRIDDKGSIHEHGSFLIIAEGELFCIELFKRTGRIARWTVILNNNNDCKKRNGKSGNLQINHIKKDYSISTLFDSMFEKFYKEAPKSYEFTNLAANNKITLESFLTNLDYHKKANCLSFILCSLKEITNKDDSYNLVYDAIKAKANAVINTKLN